MDRAQWDEYCRVLRERDEQIRAEEESRKRSEVAKRGWRKHKKTLRWKMRQPRGTDNKDYRERMGKKRLDVDLPKEIVDEIDRLVAQERAMGLDQTRRGWMTDTILRALGREP